MPLRWGNRPGFDCTAAGEASLAGQFPTSTHAFHGAFKRRICIKQQAFVFYSISESAIQPPPQTTIRDTNQ